MFPKLFSKTVELLRLRKYVLSQHLKCFGRLGLGVPALPLPPRPGSAPRPRRPALAGCAGTGPGGRSNLCARSLRPPRLRTASAPPPAPPSPAGRRREPSGPLLRRGGRGAVGRGRMTGHVKPGKAPSRHRGPLLRRARVVRRVVLSGWPCTWGEDAPGSVSLSSHRYPAPWFPSRRLLFNSRPGLT